MEEDKYSLIKIPIVKLTHPPLENLIPLPVQKYPRIKNK